MLKQATLVPRSFVNLLRRISSSQENMLTLIHRHTKNIRKGKKSIAISDVQSGWVVADVKPLRGYSPSLSLPDLAVQYNKGDRCTYSLSVHLVLVTQDCSKVISPDILNRLHKVFTSICKKWNTNLTDLSGELDYVRLVIDFPPNVEISKLVDNLKAVSSKVICKEFATIINETNCKSGLWAGAYFVASCGGVTADQVKSYVEQQRS
jgi:putative transposase